MKKLFASVLLVASAAFCDWTAEQVPAHVLVESTCKVVSGAWVPNTSEALVTVQLPGINPSYQYVGALSSEGQSRFDAIVEMSNAGRRNNRGMKYFLGNVGGDGGLKTVKVLSGTGVCTDKTFFNAYSVMD